MDRMPRPSTRPYRGPVLLRLRPEARGGRAPRPAAQRRRGGSEGVVEWGRDFGFRMRICTQVYAPPPGHRPLDKARPPNHGSALECPGLPRTDAMDVSAEPQNAFKTNIEPTYQDIAGRSSRTGRSERHRGGRRTTGRGLSLQAAPAASGACPVVPRPFLAHFRVRKGAYGVN